MGNSPGQMEHLIWVNSNKIDSKVKENLPTKMVDIITANGKIT